MAANQLRALLNGPVMAGVGATVDAGLARESYHVLPWDPTQRVRVKIEEGESGVKLTPPGKHAFGEYDLEALLKAAVYNVDEVFKWSAKVADRPALQEDFLKSFRTDLIAICTLSMAHGYYADECRQAIPAEATRIMGMELDTGLEEDVLNTEKMNRAATFVLARMHTKYQTNHAIGGTPMQASMASSVRAFYQVSPGSTRQQAAQEKLRFISDALYWALHPLNEPLLIPHVITGTRITSALVHAKGPAPETMAVEEYFAIRSKTPPASTHHFYVAAASIRALEPMGVLSYLPEPLRVKDIHAGLFMISTHGAALHPAAGHWGLERVTANQKLVETICADLGYAVRKLMPASSLSNSPILSKEDSLNAAWKSFIDALRAMIDEKGRELMDEGVFRDIAQAIAPARSDLSGIKAIKGFLTSGKIEELPEGHESDAGADSDGESSSDESGDDDDEAGDAPAAAATKPPPKTTAKGQGGKPGSGPSPAVPPTGNQKTESTESLTAPAASEGGITPAASAKHKPASWKGGRRR